VTSRYEADLQGERLKIHKCRACGKKFRTSLGVKKSVAGESRYKWFLLKAGEVFSGRTSNLYLFVFLK